MDTIYLDAEKIIDTIDRLKKRVEQRFPDAGLAKICRHLHGIAEQAHERSRWIARPIRGLRMITWTLVGVIIIGIFGTALSIPMRIGNWGLADFVQVLEAGINDVVLIGAAIFFLITLETRIKRRRALAAIHELRAIAHIIDMHQLTKDPERVLSKSLFTGSLAPELGMSRFELQRYLDYCSEMLSLTGKVAAIYVQNFDDAVALASASEVETMSTGLSRKIWQKIMVLHAFSDKSLEEK